MEDEKNISDSDYENEQNGEDQEIRVDKLPIK